MKQRISKFFRSILSLFFVVFLIWAVIFLPAGAAFVFGRRKGSWLWLLLGFLVTAGLLVFLILLCTWGKFRKLTFFVIEKLPLEGAWQGKKKLWKEQLEGMYDESEKVIKDEKLIVQMIGLNMAKLAVLYAIPWFCLRGAGAENCCGKIVCFVLAAYMILFSNCIPHIAGMGPVEISFLFLYGIFVPYAQAASAMLLYRISTYFLPFFISMLVTMKIRRKRDKKERVVYEQKKWQENAAG